MELYDQAKTGGTSRARSLRRNATEAEKALWRALREKLPEAKWRRQVPIGPYVADFLCFSARLVIELDGGQHAEAADYDARRTAFIEAQGYRVLRFWNTDITEHLPGVLALIADALARKSPSPSGRGVGVRPGAGEEEPHPPTLRAGPSLSRVGEGDKDQPSASSSSNVTATSAFALSRTVPPSIVAIRPVEI